MRNLKLIGLRIVLSEIKPYYISYIGICTMAGYVYGYNTEHYERNSYEMNTKEINKKIITNTFYGLCLGIFAPIFIPMFAIRFVNKYI
jgi:hypothetical protein